MAGLAAERRAGPTAANFQPPASLARSASSASSRSVSEASQRSVSVPLLAAIFDKPDPLSRGPSAVSSMTASTKMTLPGGRASVSTIKEMGAAEERGRAAREAETLAARRKAFGGLQAMARKGKIGLISREFEKVKPSKVTPEQRSNFRSTVFGSGLNLTDLTTAAQARTREPR